MGLLSTQDTATGDTGPLSSRTALQALLAWGTITGHLPPSEWMCIL